MGWLKGEAGYPKTDSKKLIGGVSGYRPEGKRGAGRGRAEQFQRADPASRKKMKGDAWSANVGGTT